MTERPSPPGPDTRRRWLSFAAWAVVIYLTIPAARRIEAAAGEVLGGDGFAMLGLGAVTAGLVAALASLVRSRSLRRPSQAGWLVATGVAYFAYGATQLSAPVEAMHFLQYGLLGILAHRALRSRSPDRSVYLRALLVCALVGTGDEILQWLTPRRFFEFRDVWLNTASAGFAQVAIWGGMRPAEVEPRWTARGLAQAARLGAAWVLLLGALASTTPQRLASASTFWPALGRLAGNPSVTAEYGHRIEHGDVGVFFSRLEPEGLLQADADRAQEVARLLDRYRAPELYPEFLAEVPAWRDPFAHEARVHLFRRDRYRNLAREAVDPAARRRAGTIAWRENRILEIYFPRTLADSGYPWTEAQRRRIGPLNDPGFAYESAVSRHLVTRFTPSRVLWAALIAAAALLLMERRLRIRS